MAATTETNREKEVELTKILEVAGVGETFEIWNQIWVHWKAWQEEEVLRRYNSLQTIPWEETRGCLSYAAMQGSSDLSQAPGALWEESRYLGPFAKLQDTLEAHR